MTPQLLDIPNRRPRVFVLASKQGPNWARLSLPRLHQHLVATTPQQCIELGAEVVLDKQLAVPIPEIGSGECIQVQDLFTDMHVRPYAKGSAEGLWATGMSLEDVFGEGWGFPDDEGACTAFQVCHPHLTDKGPTTYGSTPVAC